MFNNRGKFKHRNLRIPICLKRVKDYFPLDCVASNLRLLLGTTIDLKSKMISFRNDTRKLTEIKNQSRSLYRSVIIYRNDAQPMIVRKIYSGLDCRGYCKIIIAVIVTQPSMYESKLTLFVVRK